MSGKPSAPTETYQNADGEPVEMYARDAVLPPVKLIERGRYRYRRNVLTGAWVSHDKWLGHRGCGVCHTNCCDAECPGQEFPDRLGRRSGKRVDEPSTGDGADDGRHILVGEAMKQAVKVMAATVKPEELTPLTEEEQRA